MRRIILLYLFLCVYSVAQLQTIVLSFKGSVSNQDLGKNEPGVDVSIVQNGNAFGSATSASNGKYVLKGSVNYTSPFSVVFSKPGMVSKRVSFNLTNMNQEDIPPGDEYMPVADLSVALFSLRENVDFSFLNNEAVASFNWNNAKLFPELDKVASDKMKAKIEKLLLQAEQNNSANDSKYQTTIKEADNLYLTLKKYPEARSKYEEAMALKPKEKYPSDKIVELDALILANEKQALLAQQNDSEYQNLIKAADALRDQKKYEQAISKYKDASAKKNEQYPKDQILALQNVLDQQKKQAETDAKYAEAVKSAEMAFTQKNYELSKEKYLIAAALKPTETLPKTKVAEIEKLLSEQQALSERKKKYDELMAEAQSLFVASSWVEARAKYAEASMLDSDATLPKTKMAECDAKIAIAAKEKDRADKINKLLGDGATFLSTNKLAEAKGKYNDVLVLDPSNDVAKEKLKEITLKEQELAKAAEEDARFKKFVSDGDISVSVSNFSDAKSKYEAALQIKSDASVQSKLQQVDAKLKDQQEKLAQESNFLALKSEGFKLANESKFTDAKLKLNEALLIKSDVLITAKLKEIEEKEKQLELEINRDNEYRDLLTSANVLETAKDYDAAILKYREASVKKPDEKFPKEKIAALEVLKLQQAKQKETDLKYDAFMKRGDELMAQQKYLLAINEFNSALALKPNETIPVQKAKEAEEAEKSRGFEDRKQYEKIISGIEKAIGEKDYTRAKDLVERAKSFNEQFKIIAADPRPNDLLSQINRLEQADINYTAKMNEGEKFATSKEYYKAIASFEAAKIIKPNESLPQARIDDLNKIILEEKTVKEKEKLFGEYVTQGELSYNAKNYVKALENYKSALGVKPDDKAVQEKVAQITEELNKLDAQEKLAQAKKDKFDSLIREADEFFSKKDYENAALRYTAALAVDPSSNYAKKQLEECMRLKSGSEALKSEEEFKAFVKAADDFMEEKTYEKAKEEYNKALAIKPGNPYVSNKLKEIEALLNPAVEQSLSLKPLGTPYESSIMDGYAALQEAELQRKSLKDQSVSEQVNKSVTLAGDLQKNQLTNSEQTKEGVNSTINTIATNEQNADANRKLAVDVIDKAQKEIVTERSSNEIFEHSENVRSQESLVNVVEGSAIDYRSRDNVYSENSQTLSTKTAIYMETERQRELEEGSVNVADAQKITEIDKNRQSDAIDDYTSRDQVRKEVEIKRKEVTESDQAIDQDKTDELRENDRQLYSSKVAVSEKVLEDAKLPSNNENFLKEVKSDLTGEDLERSDEQVVHSAELTSTISKINVSIDQNNVERDLNRAKTTEVIRQGNEELESIGVATNKKENSKYQSNKSVLDEKGAVVTKNETEAKENLAQNNEGVKILDKKASSTSKELNISDDEERFAARKKVEIISGDIDQNSKDKEGEQSEFSEKVTDVAKAVDASKSGLEESNKNKNLLNQEKLTDAETKKSEKPKLSNSLGQEYPEGVSQESFSQTDSKGLMSALITRRIVVKDGRGDVYVRTQTLQATTYTKNGQPITESVWQRETQGPQLKKNY